MTTETLTWTPVADRLPDDDILVLLWFADGEWLAGWHEDRGWLDVSGYPVAGVTHWATVEGPK